MRRARVADTLGVAVLAYVVSRPPVELVVRTTVDTHTVGELWTAGLIVVASAYVGLSIWLEGDWRYPLHYSAPAALLVAYAAFTLPRSGGSEALTLAGRLAAWVLVIAAVERLACRRAGRSAAYAAGYLVAVAAVAAAAVAIGLDRYGGDLYSKPEFERAGQPGSLAAIAALSLAFPLVAVLRGRLVVLSSTAVVCLLVAVALSYVRASYVAATIILTGFLLARASRSAAVLARLVVVTGAAALLACVVALPQLTGRFSTGLRWEIWRPVLAAVGASVKTVLIGGGVRFSRAATEPLFPQAPGGLWAHNDFVELLATGGVVLLLAYLVFLAWLALPLFRLVRRARGSADLASMPIFVAVFIAFLALSFLSGVIFSLPSLVLALVVGRARAACSALDAGRGEPAEPNRGSVRTPVEVRQ